MKLRARLAKIVRSDRLSHTEGLIIILKHHHNLTLPEIAESLRIMHDKTEQRYDSIMEKLRDYLGISDPYQQI